MFQNSVSKVRYLWQNLTNYVLDTCSNLYLDPSQVENRMSNTLFIGKVYHRFDELPSTNDWAAEFIASGQNSAAKTRPPEGTVVRAANQTAGKGQLGSQWKSEPGENLLLSIILYPAWLEAQAQFYLSMAVALALRDLVLETIWAGVEQNPDSSEQLQVLPSMVKIKWPNDLYLGDKKAAGILIQNAISGSTLQSAIVGTGLNVNQKYFPEELPNATSLAIAFGVSFDIEQVAERLFACVERRYLSLKASRFSDLKAEYEQHLWRRGIPTTFRRSSDGEVFEGALQGVDERGHLLIQTDQEVVSFEIKEVSVVI